MTDDTPRDPLAAPEDVRQVRISVEAIASIAAQIGATVEWREPDPDGFWEPVFTRATRPSDDEALRAALVAAIIDAADIRLPDGRLVIAVRHAAAIIENTALAAPSSAPDAEGLRAAADRIERLRQRDPTSDPDDYWTGWNDALDKAKAALRGFRS
jgi:hypothetical protein